MCNYCATLSIHVLLGVDKSKDANLMQSQGIGSRLCLCAVNHPVPFSCLLPLLVNRFQQSHHVSWHFHVDTCTSKDEEPEVKKILVYIFISHRNNGNALVLYLKTRSELKTFL
jgi:hypothetical protein